MNFKKRTFLCAISNNAFKKTAPNETFDVPTHLKKNFVLCVCLNIIKMKSNYLSI